MLVGSKPKVLHISSHLLFSRVVVQGPLNSLRRISYTTSCFIFGLLLLLGSVSPQSPPWIIASVSVFTPNTTNTPNFVDSSQFGSTTIRLQSAPAPFGEVFVNALYCHWNLIQDIVIYDRTGRPLLKYASGGAGVVYSLIKTRGTSTLMLNSVKWSSVNLNFWRIQPIITNGAIMATSEPSITQASRLPVLCDQVDTDYFFGASINSLLKLSVLDGSTILDSGNYGANDYARFVFLLPGVNGVMVWFGGSENFVIFQVSTLSLLAGKTMSRTISSYSTQSKLDPRIIWNIQASATSGSELARRRVTSTPDVIISTATTGVILIFDYGSVSHMPTLGLVWILPDHSDVYTSIALRGFLILAKQDTLEVYNYVVPQGFFVAGQTFGLINPPDLDGGRRMYSVFADAVTQNVHSYYFLFDTCMNLVDSSLSCSTCPEGYWRASATMAAPLRCLAPDNFPTRTGMNNATKTFEPCAVVDCSICTYDFARCSTCNLQQYFYLHRTMTQDLCLNKQSFPSGHGLDNTKTRILPCKDQHCTECTDSFEDCQACDLTKGAFLLANYCVLKSQIPNGQGPNLLTGKVEVCKHPGCIACSSDFQICENCYVQQHWYLDRNLHICRDLKQFNLTEGADIELGVIMPCKDSACVNCKMDYTECVECKTNNLFAFQGKCKEFGGDYSPKLVVQNFFAKNLTLRIEFDRPVLLVYANEFLRDFAVVVENQLENTNHRCGFQGNLTQLLGCEFAAFENGLMVFFNPELRITKGKVAIYPDGNSTATKHAYIVDKVHSQAFKEYPIYVDGFTSDRPESILLVGSAVATAKSYGPYFSIVAALLSLSVSVVFDRYLVTLEYLSLLEGPLLVYPQQIFDISRGLSNFLPEDLIPAAQDLRMFKDLSNCVPSPAFARQDYECSALGNIGPDTVAVTFLAIVCFLITVVCNKIIDMRIRAYQKASSLSPSAEVRTNPVKVRKITEIMHKSNRFEKMESKTIRSSQETDQMSLSHFSLGNSFLPSGKIDTSQAVGKSKLIEFCSGLREIYGLSFFLLKLEANQLKLILVILLNYWNFDHGRLEQYSLIAAIIFTLYYIFQGYFTYQFADNIWKQVISKSTHTPTIPPSDQTTPSISTSTSPSADKHKNNKRTQHLSSLLPEVMAGPDRDIRANFYEGFKVPRRFLQLLGPLVNLGKCAAVAVLLVMLCGNPALQVIFAIIVEIAYLVFIIKGPVLDSKITLFCNLWSQSLVLAYLLLKLFTILINLSEATMQKGFGLWMSWILLTYCMTGATFVLYELLRMTYTKLKSCRKRKPKDTVNEKIQEAKSSAVHPPSIEGSETTRKLYSTNSKTRTVSDMGRSVTFLANQAENTPKRAAAKPQTLPLSAVKGLKPVLSKVHAQ